MSTLTNVLTRTVAEHPDAIAAADPHRHLTWSQLWDAAGRTAQALRDADLTNRAVMLALPPGTGWITALIAAWRAGAVAVPVDVTHPPTRLAQIATACRASGALTATAQAPAWAGHLTALAPADGAATAPHSTNAPLPAPWDDDIACIWHTSGSSGSPKPVLISHRALAARATALPGVYGLTRTDRIAQLTSPTFDAVLWEILGALATGARLQIAGPAERLPGPLLTQFLREQRITAFTCTPTQLAATEFAELPELRRIVLGGEALRPEPLTAWLRAYKIANAYGPTEACLAALVAEHVSSGETPVPIGHPLPGVTAWILNEEQQPVPHGDTGELYLGGTGLADGYLGRDAETQQAFPLLELPLPDGGVGRVRVYRTGDRVWQRPDGQYVFVGRVDDQLNVGGVRLEPGEVEAAACRMPGVRAAALHAERPDDGARHRLVLHVEADDVGLPPQLRRHLARVLPPSAVPALITVRARLPRTASGKIDRLALAHADDQTDRAAAPAAAPTGRLPDDVAQWWQENTGSPAVGSADFFACGGDSLSALLLVQKINETYGTEITIGDFYADPTMTFLSAALSSRSSS
ncbi:amino acid adenylation domain-containing protein [Streptomyces umbrinus]|uniref:Amino acid adenylation domain-containing protein n=1 Tax=Streptomyces umbrinus TaxID=67370 RepID=A0ABU0T6N2_9ACTN|nr:non-ribosomal peptide synthetase [Streptomyces umbrinus]MDQ1031459.1 amino acid adenylation domain-containing protein [Streptomyces umbrinus]